MSAKVKFVINTIAHVQNISLEDFEDDSDDEEIGGNFENLRKDPPEIKDVFPYKLKEATFQEYNDLINKLRSKNYCSRIIEPFLEKLLKQAFINKEQIVEENIAKLVVKLNIK